MAGADESAGEGTPFLDRRWMGFQDFSQL